MRLFIDKREELKYEWKVIFFQCLLWCGWGALVAAVWEIVELYMTGTTTPRDVDTVMGFLMSTALWLLTKHHIEVK